MSEKTAMVSNASIFAGIVFPHMRIAFLTWQLPVGMPVMLSELGEECIEELNCATTTRSTTERTTRYASVRLKSRATQSRGRPH